MTDIETYSNVKTEDVNDKKVSSDNEINGFIDEIEKLLLDNEDTKTVEQCVLLQADINQTYDQCKLRIKELIEITSSLVEDAQFKADAIAAETPTNPEIDKLEKEIVMIENRIKNNQIDAISIRKQVGDMENEIKSFEEASKKAKQLALKKELPEMCSMLKLYASVTNIKWDLENCTKKIISGWVIKKDDAGKKIFISLEKKSKYEIANQLWGLL